MQKHLIVLARKEIAHRSVGQARVDLGYRPKIEEYDVGVALVWLLSGDETDVTKAQHFASVEGYAVFLYPTDEQDPLNRARREILK